MADKTIPELQLKSSVVGDESMPADNGIQTYRITPSQLYDYLRTRFIFGIQEISNLSLTTAVGSNALTIAVKTKAAADPSSSDPVRVGFRSATLTSGAYNTRTITGSLSLVISSGSTLGQASGQASRIWVYLIDNAGTLELAASHKRFRDDELVSTTAEGGAGAADSATVMYSASARSSVPCRCIGYIDNTQATAGTWASAGSTIQLMPVYITKRPTKQILTSGSGTYYKPAGCTRINVIAIGGGAGGAGGGTTSPSGSAGGDTTFGSITAGGGPNAADFGGTTGGTGSGGDFHVANRGHGVPGNTSATNWGSCYGGAGANGPRGGLGGNGGNNAPAAGGSGANNTGAGGGGGGGNGSGRLGGPGGGSGALVEAMIVDPLASYAYSIGGGGGGGSAGTGGAAGGAGGTGLIMVEEYYD